MMESRTCTRCGATLPAEMFHRDVRRRYGRASACKTCHREQVRAYRARVRDENRRASPNTAPSKLCGCCGLTKGAAEFHRNASVPGGLHWICKSCNNAGKRASDQRTATRRIYGVTRSEIDARRHAQDDRCAICRTGFDENPHHVDHNHVTGRFRGLLCMRCNTGIGLLGEDVTVLRSAIAYLAADGDREADRKQP